MKDYKEICRQIREDDDAKSLEFILSKVFADAWMLELSRDDWIGIAQHEDVLIREIPIKSTRVRACFAKLVKRGYLYSAMSKGVRVYGLKLNDE